MYAYVATYIFHYLHAYGITVAQAYTKLNCNNYTDSIACYTLYYKAIKMLRIAQMGLLALAVVYSGHSYNFAI